MTDEEILEIKGSLERPKPHFAEDNEPVAIAQYDLKAILQSWDDKRRALDGVFILIEGLRLVLGLSKEATLEEIVMDAQRRIIGLKGEASA